MRFRTQLIWTFLIQGAGAAALFVTVIFIGFFAGAEAQGLFNRVKSEVEFVAVVALFGMPPAVLFFIASKRLSVRSAIRVTFGVGAIAALVACFYLAVSHRLNHTHVVVFAAACATYATHSIIRVLVLSSSGTILFNVVTSLPQILILLLVGALVHLSSITSGGIVTVYFVAFASAVAVAWIALRNYRNALTMPGMPEAKLPEMVRYGAATAVGTASNALANLLWIRHAEAALDLTAVGIFTMGLTFVQVAVTPINYATPLLLKRWVESPRQPSVVPALATGALTFAIIAALLQFTGFLPASIASSPYGELFKLQWCFAIAATAEVTLRVPMSAVYAAGRPWFFPLAEAVRLGVLLVALLVGFTGSLVSISWTWALAAAISTFVLICSVVWRQR